MSKNIKGAIPKWRFLEFKGNGDWERKKLGEMAFIVNDKIAIEKLNAETYISTENMLPNFAGVSTASQLPQTGNFTKFKAGDILVSNIRPYLKKVWRSNKTGGASNDVIVFRSNSDIDSNFLEFILKNELFINYVMKNAKGLKMPRGDKESMLIYPVYIPPYPTFSEQQKIADCLSSIDELISAEEKKLALLNDYKKGWMQKLFPAEGKTVPEWRFPEFRDSGEWKTTSLGEICGVLNGVGFPIKMQGNSIGKYSFFKVSDISNAVMNNGGILLKAANCIDDNVLLKLRAKTIPRGTTVFAKIGEALRLNRRAITSEECLIDNNVIGVKAKPKKADDYFIFLLLQLIDLERYCGGVIPSVKKTVIEEIEVSFISDLKEQQKIADFISGLVQLIRKQTDKIEALKQHKKALMQGLFPVAEEV
ncbi:restriction endonuclease subunit S [Pseudoramibacter alactolyticus]|uniref:restriction endonuclease subunit S n=1 Tax=Pseudoramibacter alactolyticus TaxID=113287 RepID=UPI0028EA46FD|nr:restriction endonuclease subunit S [Pseudoramibacter alactolyticus]